MDEEEEVKFTTEFVWYTCKFCLEIFHDLDPLLHHQKVSHVDQIKHFITQSRIRQLVIKKAEEAKSELEGQTWKKEDSSACSTTATTTMITKIPAAPVEFSATTTTTGGQVYSSSNGCGLTASPLMGKQPLMMSIAELHDEHMNTNNKMSPAGLLPPPQPLPPPPPNPFMPNFATTFPSATTTALAADIFGGQQNPPPHYYHQNHHHHPQPVVDYVYCNRCNQNVFHSNVDSHIIYCQQQQRKKEQLQRKLAAIKDRKSKLDAKKVVKPTATATSAATAAAATIPRPPLTYACMSALALKNSKTGQLPTSAIYQFICDNFPYYRALPTAHWRNSLRHALATSDAFNYFTHETENEQVKGQSWKRGVWTISPEPRTALQMEEKLRLAMTKNRVGILATMSEPDKFPLIERGELKTDVCMAQAEQL